MVAEIQDFFRRRAEVEMEYARSLDKLVKNTLLKHKAEKQKYVQIYYRWIVERPYFIVWACPTLNITSHHTQNSITLIFNLA